MIDTIAEQPPLDPAALETFLATWTEAAPGSERSNYQTFANQLWRCISGCWSG